MTSRHQPIRDLVDQHRPPDPYEKYKKHRDAACEYMADAIAAADLSVDPALSIAAAQVLATLALAAATVHTKSCGVHCHATGC